MADGRIALAGMRAQPFWTAYRKPGAPGFDDAALPQVSNDTAQIGAADPQHCCKLFLRHRQVFGACPFCRGQQPSCRALFDRMSCAAGDGLEYLGHQAIGVAGKQVTQCQGPQFGFFEMVQVDPEE